MVLISKIRVEGFVNLFGSKDIPLSLFRVSVWGSVNNSYLPWKDNNRYTRVSANLARRQLTASFLTRGGRLVAAIKELGGKRTRRPPLVATRITWPTHGGVAPRGPQLKTGLWRAVFFIYFGQGRGGRDLVGGGT